MSNRRIFYEIQGKGMEPCGLSKPFVEQAKKTWMCPECKKPHPEWKSIDVILGWRPPKRPLNIIFRQGMCVAQREFLDLLGREEVERDLYLGHTADEEGDEFQNFTTVRGRHVVIVHGVAEPGCWTCPTCGRNCYYNKAANKHPFLYPAPPSDADILETHGGTLAVTEKILARIDAKWRKKIYITKLTICEALPPDGFADLRSVYASKTGPPPP